MCEHLICSFVPLHTIPCVQIRQKFSFYSQNARMCFWQPNCFSILQSTSLSLSLSLSIVSSYGNMETPNHFKRCQQAVCALHMSWIASEHRTTTAEKKIAQLLNFRCLAFCLLPIRLLSVHFSWWFVHVKLFSVHQNVSISAVNVIFGLKM